VSLVNRIPKNSSHKNKSSKRGAANRGGRSYGDLNVGSSGRANARGTGMPAKLSSSVREPRVSRLPEAKYVDTVSSAAVVNTSSLVDPFTMPAQGITPLTRIGNSIDCIRLEGSLQFFFGSGTASPVPNASQVFRWYIVKYNKTLDTTFGAPPSINTFLDADQGGNYTPMSLPDVEHMKDWTIFASGQETMDLNAWNTAGNTNKTHIVSFVHECSFPIDFDSTGAASCCNNLPFLIVTAMNAVNTGSLSNIAWNMRTVFTDA